MSIRKILNARTIPVLCLLLMAVEIFSYSAASAAFQNTPGGARPAGLGGAFTAVADDANTVLWNPAGIARFEFRHTVSNL